MERLPRSFVPGRSRKTAIVTRALKTCVHRFLEDRELIDRFAFAPDTQGGHGATIAEMKL